MVEYRRVQVTVGDSTVLVLRTSFDYPRQVIDGRSIDRFDLRPVNFGRASFIRRTTRSRVTIIVCNTARSRLGPVGDNAFFHFRILSEDGDVDLIPR